jgi:hypothetical protein
MILSHDRLLPPAPSQHALQVVVGCLQVAGLIGLIKP